MHLALGVGADAHGPDRRRLFHPRRHVDAEAADAALGVDAATQQHAAGVHADANVEAGVAVALKHGLTLRAAFGQQGQAGVNGAFGVVFQGHLGTEDRQQVVAGVLQHLAMVGQHDGGEARQRAVDHRMNVLGVQILTQRGGADDVEKQDAHLLQRLPALGVRCSRLQREALFAQRGQRGVDHRVADQRTLRFQCSDGGFDLLQLGRHAGEDSKRVGLARHGCRSGGSGPAAGDRACARTLSELHPRHRTIWRCRWRGGWADGRMGGCGRRGDEQARWDA